MPRCRNIPNKIAMGMFRKTGPRNIDDPIKRCIAIFVMRYSITSVTYARVPGAWFLLNTDKELRRNIE